MSDLNLDQPTSPTPTPQPAPAAAPAAEPTDFKTACAELQREAFNLRVILLVVVLSLAAFFWREAGYFKFEAAQLQPQAIQANQVLEALAKQQTSIDQSIKTMQAIVNRLTEYAKLHPDYAQVLAKYGVQVQTVAPAKK